MLYEPCRRVCCHGLLGRGAENRRRCRRTSNIIRQTSCGAYSYSRVRTEGAGRNPCTEKPTACSCPGMSSDQNLHKASQISIDLSQIIQVSDIPYTLNGKRVEVLVKKVRVPRGIVLDSDSHPTDYQWSAIVLSKPSYIVESRVLDVLPRYWGGFTASLPVRPRTAKWISTHSVYVDINIKSSRVEALDRNNTERCIA